MYVCEFHRAEFADVSPFLLLVHFTRYLFPSSILEGGARAKERSKQPLRCKSHRFFTIYAGMGIFGTRNARYLSYSTVVKFQKSSEDDIIVETSSPSPKRCDGLRLGWILSSTMKMLENIRFFSTDSTVADKFGNETDWLRLISNYRVIYDFYIRSFYDFF